MFKKVFLFGVLVCNMFPYWRKRGFLCSLAYNTGSGLRLETFCKLRFYLRLWVYSLLLSNGLRFFLRPFRRYLLVRKVVATELIRLTFSKPYLAPRKVASARYRKITYVGSRYGFTCYHWLVAHVVYYAVVAARFSCVFTNLP
jgi:hypothetical protein